ncbi:hypothetical protein JCM10450v2_003739 [Rhodotorula kratochvilovae]
MRPRCAPTALLALLIAALSTLLAGASRVQVQPGALDSDGKPTINLSIDPAEGFTMMIATYKRDENLPPLIKHLTTTPPPSLRHIVIIWQNVGVPVPDFLNATALERYSTSGVVVSVRKSQRNSMNERFRPILDWSEEVYTDAIMIVDDDVVLQRNALEWGYQQFVEANRAGPGRLVGFSARDYDEVDGEIKYVVRPRTTYSMVLSNAAWLRKEWLHKYWEESDEMRGLRDYVDEVFNCDDLLINYLVSNLTGQPPLVLQPKTPLRTIPGDGLFHRGSIAVPDDTPTQPAPPSADDLPTPDAAVDAAAGMPTPGHFDQRRLCLEHYFSHFAAFAPLSPRSGKKEAFYPLVRTSTSASQDVEDHARWLHKGELWEDAVWAPAPAPAVRKEPEWEEMDAEEMDWSFSDEDEAREKAEFERMLEGMSDEEIDELMGELKEMLAQEEGEDDATDGEEGLGEMLSAPSVFEEVDAEEEAPPHAHDEL